MARSMFMPMFKVLIVHGKEIQIEGGIKSLDPPCLQTALSYGEHPYTCKNCASQIRELKDTIRHRKAGNYNTVKNRIGLVGFNKRYARKGEIHDALSIEVQRRKAAEKHISHLTRIKLTPFEWENHLMDVCRNRDDAKLFLDLLQLFSNNVSQKNPFQVIVLKNLVSKLQKGNNHHYIEMIKDVSGLFKNELGPINYSILADIFGLARETTAATHASNIRLDPGISAEVIERAAVAFETFPVNEASDGARALRYLQPFLSASGKVLLLGKSWNPDVSKWSEAVFPVPRMCIEQGDKDDFDALKRAVDNIILKDQLSKSVSVHTLVSLASLETPTIIYCMWPEPNKGYKACHLLKYWEELRKRCFYNDKGNPRSKPISLMGYSTDSAGFSLAAAVQLMTPTNSEVVNGVCFLGLGTNDERFLAPYYWSLPSIAYLDYDHEQRLFLKNIKYETRDLTIWEESGKESRIVTINHLKDLRQRCQRENLECGFSASDLNLIYFFDQNSDACERLFTIRIADLLDMYVPGSQGTSLYIRAVFNLIEPFRNPAFGSPYDVQRSVSCGITVFRLWKRVLELKKMRLHSLPGAKNNPSRRGNFLTSGCYQTAEIQFAAATLHQLAMFLHFKNLGMDWASPYFSGTKATERVISEMQGKTNEIQSLDAQPTYADMLQRSSKVQFNISAKARLAKAGVHVKASAKRRRISYSFKEHTNKVKKDFVYPATYAEFKGSQKEAHLQGSKDGQTLFSRYLPHTCIQYLKNSGFWEMPYSSCHPTGIEVVEAPPSRGYNKLNQSFSLSKEKEVPQELQCEEVDDAECVKSTAQDLTDDYLELNAVGGGKFFEDETQGKPKKWRISKRLNDGTLSHIDIRQAIKLLLPREYIARCRQKRHWAAKHLPGKAPMDPKHDIVKYCDVAIKFMVNGKRHYDVGRIEVLQSTKDGSDVISFQLDQKAQVRLRCSLYLYSLEDERYNVSRDVMLTAWKSPSSIIGPVQLVADPDRKGSYTLHQQNIFSLGEMEWYPRGASCPQFGTITKNEDFAEVEEGFYEIDEVLEQRVTKDMVFEYKVRFKGYGPEDDMWLPGSFFNRSVSFESVSKYGRKRKHATDISVSGETVPSKRQKQEVIVNGVNATATEPLKSLQNKNQTATPIIENEDKSDKVKSIKTKRSNAKATNKKHKSRNKRSNKSFSKEKALKFRRSLSCSQIQETNSSDSEIDSMFFSSKKKQRKLIEESDNSDENSGDKKQGSTPKKSGDDCCGIVFVDEDNFAVATMTKKSRVFFAVGDEIDRTAKDNSVETIVVDDKDPYPFSSNLAPSLLQDLCKGTDSFVSGREELQQVKIPPVDPQLTEYRLISLSNKYSVLNPFKVSRIPPPKTIINSEEDLRRVLNDRSVPNAAIQIIYYGVLNKEALTILRQYHRLKEISLEVEQEKKWIGYAFCKETESDRKMVESALFRNRSGQGRFLVTENGSQVIPQTLSHLCKERYLCDEIINVLLHHYCTKANHREKRTCFLSLPAYVSDLKTGKEIIKNNIESVLSDANVEEVECIFVPLHLEEEAHWGLGVIQLREGIASFDDGFHKQRPSNLVRICEQLTAAVKEVSKISTAFPASFEYQRMNPPMPDQNLGYGQKHGFGSCGVGVILCVRDLCERKQNFGWNFNQAPFLRARLMVELVKLSLRS